MFMQHVLFEEFMSAVAGGGGMLVFQGICSEEVLIGLVVWNAVGLQGVRQEVVLWRRKFPIPESTVHPATIGRSLLTTLSMTRSRLEAHPMPATT